MNGDLPRGRQRTAFAGDRDQIVDVKPATSVKQTECLARDAVGLSCFGELALGDESLRPEREETGQEPTRLHFIEVLDAPGRCWKLQLSVRNRSVDERNGLLDVDRATPQSFRRVRRRACRAETILELEIAGGHLGQQPSRFLE